MKRLPIYSVVFVCILMLAGCANVGGKPTLDQAIQYRSGFNTMLAQWNTELTSLEPLEQKAWAQKAAPFVQSAVLALDTMDLAVGLGSTPSPETVQQFLVAKNKMIDLMAQLALAKGGK